MKTVKGGDRTSAKPHRSPGRKGPADGRAQRDEIMPRLNVARDEKAFAECDLLIEAIVEDLAAKTAVLAKSASDASQGCRDRVQYLIAVDQQDRRSAGRAVPLRGHALFQSGSAHAAGRSGGGRGNPVLEALKASR